MPDKKDWISIPQFATLQGVKKQYIYALLENGKIPENVVRYKTPGGKHFVIHKELAAEAMGLNIKSRQKYKTEEKSNGIKKEKLIKSKKSQLPQEQQKIIEKAGLKIFDTLTEAQKHKETYLAALKKLEYEGLSKNLIPAEEVKRDAVRAARIVKEKVTSWPGRVAALVAVETDVFKVDQILRQECNQLLEEISKEVFK